MNDKRTSALSEPIVQLQRQLDQFRSTQSGRAKLPEPLWQAAVELARQHGVHAVAHPLRLDYMGLKKRLSGDPLAGRKVTSTKPAFVELSPRPVTSGECMIEFDSPSGGKMRIQWKATMPPDWTSLLRAWRETEG